ncbi:hypothetical protein pb186bvf_015999 [Paramecium bursaria]
MAKHNSGGSKQKNKQFKGESKRKSKQKQTQILKKQIKKKEPQPQQSDTMQTEKQKKVIKETPYNPYEQDLKKTKKPKIIALIPFNEEANCYAIRQMIIQHLQLQNLIVNSYDTQEFFLNVPTSKINKQPLQFIFLNRDIDNILDACKIADIMVPVLSCRESNVQQLAIDPLNNARAFDNQGYKILSNLRAQGVLPTICLIQDLDQIQQNKRAQVKKLFNRYFQSEFKDSHIIGLEQLDNIQVLIRQIVGTQEPKLEWRDSRGYMIPEDICFVNNELSIQGIWRGTVGINPNQLIHITGIDDFQIKRIEIIRQMEEQETLHRDEALAESYDPICRNKQIQDIGDDFLKEIENLQLQDEGQQEKEMEIDSQSDDISYDEQDEDFDQQDQDAEKKRLQQLDDFEITARAPEDLDYEDEIDYKMDVKLRERYEKYQGLKNIRTDKFDPLTFLPDEAEQIFNLRYLKKIKQDALQYHLLQKQFPPGVRVKITLQLIEPQLLVAKLNQPKIYVISGLLQHERKMTQMHVKMHRHNSYDQVIKSKQDVYVQVGFRRAKINPIYSRILTNCTKTKFVKTIRDDEFYLCSFYFLTSYPPQNILFYNSDQDFVKGNIIGTGEISRCDAFQVILKRIVLTGYPFKINKRKAVIRLMFYNPDDIKYFKPVELATKLGLKGNIIEPIGTHGLMKCRFNNFIRPNDIISLSLYKRIHPRFPKIM